MFELLEQQTEPFRRMLLGGVRCAHCRASDCPGCPQLQQTFISTADLPCHRYWSLLIVQAGATTDAAGEWVVKASVSVISWPCWNRQCKCSKFGMTWRECWRRLG
jgi:hypothetical protein